MGLNRRVLEASAASGVGLGWLGSVGLSRWEGRKKFEKKPPGLQKRIKNFAQKMKEKQAANTTC